MHYVKIILYLIRAKKHLAAICVLGYYILDTCEFIHAFKHAVKHISC